LGRPDLLERVSRSASETLAQISPLPGLRRHCELLLRSPNRGGAWCVVRRYSHKRTGGILTTCAEQRRSIAVTYKQVRLAVD
jgi:hypothetical protein